jgi:hypothetical protein
MATSTTELILKFSGDPRNLKETLAQVRGDLTNLGKAQVSVARESNKQVATEAKNQTRTLEQEERARARAAESLQRQRSAALIAIWKAELREKARLDKEAEEAAKKAGQLFNFEGFAGNIPILRNFTSQFSSLSGEAAGATSILAGVGGAIAIMVAGAAVGVAALAKLGSEIFDLTKKTAEFQGKFFDLSQQVGVSVETLSTLDVIASTTGGNIDTVAASLAIFQKHLEASHDPTSKEAKLLKELEVTSLDTETALRQALKGIFDLGEGSKQTDATLQLFGRSGRFVNAILKESKGDLDEAAKAFGGLQISREAAAAADAFNDSLEILNRTLARVGANIVSDAIPVFTVFFQDMNKGLTGNADDWSFWADLIKTEVAGVLGTLQGFILFVKSGFTVDLGIAIDTSIRSLLDRAEELRKQNNLDAAIAEVKRSSLAALAGRPGDKPDADKANSEAQTRAAKSIALQQRVLEESTRVHRENLERERDRDIKSIDEWESESIKAALDHRDAMEEIYNKEVANVRKFIKNTADAKLAEDDILLKRIKTTNETAAAIQKIQDDAQKKRDQSELSLNQQLLKIRDAQRAAELQDIKHDADLAITTESGAIQRRMALLTQEFDDRKVLRDLESAQISTSAERQIQITNEKLESEIKYTSEYKRLSQERIAALLKEGVAATPPPGTLPPRSDKDIAQQAGAAADQAAGIPPPPGLTGDVFEKLGGVIQQTLGLAGETAKTFGDLIADTFGNVAQAVGSAVQAFVLFGTVQGGFRKFAAEVIASVAQMAVVQSVFELAQGLAMLALTWFTGNPKYAQSAGAHFAAAAAFGIIGGVAALAGRAVAGNSFNQSGAGGASGGGGGGGTSRTSGTGTATATQPVPVNLDRATLNQQAIVNLNVNVTRDAGSIVEVIVDNHRNNGEVRQLILDEIKR